MFHRNKTMDYACKISIIIPVYNMAQYLDKTIASWTAQTLKDIEIIYVDDGSSDGSLRLLEEKARANNRILVFAFPANKGTWAARNYGIEKASGRYILFADADDTVLPETCEELAMAMDESQTDILQYSIEVLNPNGLPEKDIADWERWLTPYYVGVQHGKDAFTICFRERKHSWTLWGKVYKTKICKEVLSDIIAAGIKDEHVRIAEDALLYFMLSYTAKSYKGIHGKKYYQYYLGHGGFGQKEYTLAYFEYLCMQSRASDLIKAFLERHGTLDTYADTVHGMRRSLLNNVIKAWNSNLAESDRAQGFDLMLHYWNHDEIIGKLAGIRFNEPVALATLLKNSVSLRYDGHPVKTIATYYHRIANGETERIMCQLCCIWQAMGYRIIVLTDETPSKEDFELPSAIERIAIPDYQTITPQTYRKRAAELRRIIIDYHIDAVVHHAWTNPLLFWDVLAIKTSGAACLIYCHGIFSLGMQWNPRYENILAPATITDALITLSETNHYFWKYDSANVHVTIPPLSYDLKQWRPAPFSASHKILWLGRLSPEKNPMDVLPIMQDVIQVVPDAELTIVGKSEDGSVEKQLQEHITKLHLEDHIKLEGFHTDIRPWYLSSQLFLMTSSYEDYSITLHEGKMAGIPCVMYELPYLTLCKGNRGIISVPQRDTKAAAQAIIKLLQDDTLCDQYGHDARAHVEELAQFDFQKKWRQIFESVEHTHAPIDSKAEKEMDTLIAYHEKSLQNAKDVRDKEIKWLSRSWTPATGKSIS